MRLSVLAATMIASAGSASASGTISCGSEDGASVELTLGSLPVLTVVRAHAEAGGQSWTTAGEAGPGTIAVGQAFRDGDRMLVDFTDPNVERVLIELRLQTATEEDYVVTAGTLRVAGQGVHALTCVGP